MKRKPMRLAASLALSCVALLGALPAAAQTASPQPPAGPGGEAYSHEAVARKGPYWASGHFLDNAYRYYIYEPAQPRPESAPVVLFLHAWGANRPSYYPDWIEHLARKGYTVVWVQYDRFLQPFSRFATHARVAFTSAVARMERRWWERHVPPERDENGDLKTIFVGHSTGGYLAAILAAQANDPDYLLPKPRAVVAVEPGAVDYFPPYDLTAIDPATRLVVVVGDEDDVACASSGRAIWDQTGHFPDANRDFLVVVSDRRGSPEQIANHGFPMNHGLNDTAQVDARDYNVSFKLSVAAANCVFRGTECEYAFGGGHPAQLDMGMWSDGVPIEPMRLVDDPSTLATTCVDP